jgi:cytochrome c
LTVVKDGGKGHCYKKFRHKEAGGGVALLTRNVAGSWAARAAFAGLIFVTLSPGSLAAEKGLADQGEVLVRDNCSRCHAIGKEGDSPHPEAPPFRTLGSRYPIEDLAESLAEGIVSGHPDMPIFVFSPTDVEAIIQYLKSIQAP